MRHEIISVYKANGNYMARFECRLADGSLVPDSQIEKLFGSCVIPTAFTDRALPSQVQAQIQALNPLAEVTVYS